MGGTQEEGGWLGVATYVVGGVEYMCVCVSVCLDAVVAVRGLRAARGAHARPQKRFSSSARRARPRQILDAQTHQPTQPKSMVDNERTHSNQSRKSLNCLPASAGQTRSCRRARLL